LERFALEGGGFSLGVEKSESPDLVMEAVGFVTKAVVAGENQAVNSVQRAWDEADLLASASTAIVKALGLPQEDLEKWPVVKGKNLAAAMNRQIDAKSEGRFERADLIKKIAEALGLTASTITQMLRSEINCATKPQLTTIAKVLGISAQTLINAAVRDGCRFELAKEEEIRCFAEPGSEDPDVILQAGDAMRVIKLSQFENAVEQLNTRLTALKGGNGMSTEDKVQDPKTQDTLETPTDVTPVDVPVAEVPPPVDSIEKSVEAALIKGFEVLEKRVAEKLATGLAEGLTEVKSAIDAVTKRVDSIETSAPAGSELDPDATTPTKKSDDVYGWGSILGSNR
jgi:transcriptional regulator with XRE-family HTH domain